MSRKTKLGTYYFNLGWGWRVYTMRGWITVDTWEEVEEELASLPVCPQCSIGSL